MGRQRAAERDRQRKKRKIKRERRCQSSDDATNTDNGHGGAATSSVSDGGTAVHVAADVGRSGKKRRRRMRQQAAAAGRNAQVSTSANGTSSVSGETEVTTSNGRADHMQNIGEDGKSGIDADTPKANVATAAASKTLEKDDDAMRIERMRLKKQQRKAAREAIKKKVQAAAG